MNESELLSFLRSHRWAIEATAAAAQRPQAAIIGIVTAGQLELVFDTLASSRKAMNLRANPHVALVIGGWNDGDPRTVQYEGVADFPAGAELERLKLAYFAASEWAHAPLVAGHHIRPRQTDLDPIQRLSCRATCDHRTCLSDEELVMKAPRRG